MPDGTIEGGPGDDRLEGRDGDYVLRGRGGNDFYIVDQGDVVDERPGEGFDRVFARTSYILAAGAEVEQLATFDYRLTNYMLLRGNELNNPITGNNGDNSLDGMAGSDYLTGLEGNDRLDGGAGRDHMVGGLGNDIYIVDDPLDSVIEYVGQGLDYLFTSTTFLLQPGTEIEL
ncbi:calcium-binding protein, partial [Allosphingosinicella sp.]|uniref:calcium-binding protein n=1 Tax=Allosphingosinicella sp. TaxID=2823234 RepID=UPI002EF152E1